jgi:NitT/TauT family transport system ATP-binding protein
MLAGMGGSTADAVGASAIPAPLISCRSLSKEYGSRVGTPIAALKDLNIEIPVGEFLAIVGPSGCGKTTLLRLLAGLDQKTQGEIDLGGNSVDGPRKDVGVVFQTATLLAWRNVLENILLPVDVLDLSRKDYQKRAMQLIEMAKLSGFEQKYPWELSGGMQQRVAICRSLINQPRLLLMDEPFGALDALTRDSMNAELESIWRSTGQTIVLITHSIPEAVFLGTRVAIMSARPGTIIEVLTIDLPRPRTLDMTTSEAFSRHVRRIRSILDGVSPPTP